MPRDKQKRTVESSEDSSSSELEDRNPPAGAKKAKTDASSSSKGKTGSGEPSWELEKNRFVKLQRFKGKVYVDIREYYDAGGELKPGKKGIGMTVGQWEKFKTLIPEVDEALKDF